MKQEVFLSNLLKMTCVKRKKWRQKLDLIEYGSLRYFIHDVCNCCQLKNILSRQENQSVISPMFTFNHSHKKIGRNDGTFVPRFFIFGYICIF